MADSMMILQIVEPGRAVWQEAPVPDPGEGEALVRVESVTTCPHWDLHLMNGEPMFPGAPLDYPYTPGQPGHEAMGRVVAVGQGVTSPATGSRVVAWRDAGHQRQGCYAGYVPFAADNLLEIPEDLPAEKVTSLELAMCVEVSFGMLARLSAVEGKRFGVGGLGSAGLVAAQMARAYGASEVVAFDPLPQRRELARSLGVDRVLPPDAASWPADRRGASALDAAIDCTGLKASIEYLMERTRQAVAIFGVLRETVDFRADYWSGLTLMGYEPHNRDAAERALKLVLDGHLDLASLTTRVLPLSQYAEGVELLRSKQAIKIRFLPWEE